MLKFSKAPVFRFQNQMLDLLDHYGSQEPLPCKRVIVKADEDGLRLNNLGRTFEAWVLLKGSGIDVIYEYHEPGQQQATVVEATYERGQLSGLAQQLVKFFEGTFNPRLQCTPVAELA